MVGMASAVGHDAATIGIVRNCSSKGSTVLLLSSRAVCLACASFPPLLRPNAATVSCRSGVPA
eukprot:8325864-Pyramimonas_sp.AAC.1